MPVPGACDCHVHIVGPREQFQQAATRSYTAAPAELESLRALAEPLGVTRYVVVQPSFYGVNNACLLAALAKLGERGRGVIAADAARTAAPQMEWYAGRGVRGVRINLYSKGVAETAGPLEPILAGWRGKFPDSGWHLEIIAPLRVLLSGGGAIANSPAPVVIDHYGLPGDAEPDSAAGKKLLKLAASPQVWFKLSAPYRTLADPLATRPPAAWLRALLEAAPDRCVWGSDWPHTPPHQEHHGAGSAAPYRPLSYVQVLEDFLAALPEPGMAQRILAENPRKLYGFQSE